MRLPERLWRRLRLRWVQDWQLVSLRLMRRRVLRDVAGPWAAAVDFRARMLAE